MDNQIPAARKEVVDYQSNRTTEEAISEILMHCLGGAGMNKEEACRFVGLAMNVPMIPKTSSSTSLPKPMEESTPIISDLIRMLAALQQEIDWMRLAADTPSTTTTSPIAAIPIS